MKSMPRRDTNLAAAVLLALACAALAAPAALAGERIRIEGLLDAEAWNTAGASRYLERNEDEAAGLGRLRLWTIGQFAPGLQGFALGEVEDGDAAGEEETTLELEQAYLRYTASTALPLAVEAGKLAAPFGNFSRRYFSDVNPLIGEPSSYGVAYPTVLQARMRAGRLDGTFAVMDRPMVNESWVPESDSRARPALALGVTPVVGARFGIFATRGSYLGGEVQDEIPAGSRWQEYGQTVLGFDVQFSRGYFELNGEFANSSYEVPTFDRNSRGVAWFLEPRYTFTPRLFGAVRYERNDYPYIMPRGGGAWTGRNSDLSTVEIAAGYRLWAGATLKVSWRADQWHVEESRRASYPAGSAIAAQLSWRFDVKEWFDRPL